jgi:hypothetical protein
MILVGYALLPEQYRFSRALILIGAAWSALALPALRMALHALFGGSFALRRSGRKRIVIVAGGEEAGRILSVLQMAGTEFSLTGFVNPPGQPARDALALGDTGKLREIVEVYGVEEVIFSARDLPAQQIMSLMQSLGRAVEYKIAPPESAYVIGSNTTQGVGSLYLVDLGAVNDPANRRKKRLFDLAVCLALLPAFPVLAFVLKDFKMFLANWLRVLAGRSAWVGLPAGGTGRGRAGKPGVLSPADGIPAGAADETIVARLNVLYAKDYSVYNDWRIVRRAFRRLDRRTDPL